MEKFVKKLNTEFKKKVGVGKNQKLLIHAISTFETNTDLVTNHRVKATGVTFECAKGCSHCYNLRVEVLPPEVFHIANHIKSLPVDTQKIYIEKLKEQSSYAQGKPFVEYNKACLFLSEKGTCGIYAVRPHKCRSHLSKNLSSCIETRDADTDFNLKVAHNQLAHETVEVYKSKGCIMHPTELSQGVLAALEDSELETKWFNGSQIFELLPEGIEL